MALPAPVFRLLIVPGVTVSKWGRVWSERLPETELQVVTIEAAQALTALAADGDAGLVRLPVDRDVFDAIPLYTETTVAVVPRDHLLAAADELTVADMADETLLRPLDDVLAWPGDDELDGGSDRPATTADAIALVPAEVGILVLPQSIARLHQRRDLTSRVVTDAPVSTVALAWRKDRYTDLVEEMIGIVRGRTAHSTRGRSAQPPPTTTARASQPKPAAGRAGRSGAGRGSTGRSSTGRDGTGRSGTGKPPRKRGR
jgi:DNA-binding transcriptional LysR family regulator